MTALSQKYIAEKLGVSPAYISYLVNIIKRPSWKRAKQLAEITNTDPILWLEGTPEQIKESLQQSAHPPER